MTFSYVVLLHGPLEGTIPRKSKEPYLGRAAVNHIMLTPIFVGQI